MAVDINFMVGGEAGQGVQSAGLLMAKAFARGGHCVFADQDYESRVRGGHNFFRVRVKDSTVGAIAEVVDILIALNRGTIELHKKEVSPEGIIIYDYEKITGVKGKKKLFGVPLNRLAEEKGGNRLMANTVALGAGLGLVNYEFKLLEELLNEQFGKSDVAAGNVSAAWAGYEYVRVNYKGSSFPELKILGGRKRMLLTGNEAIALGAIAAGCRFISAYPMTPATSIMEYMASKAEEMGIVVVHAEDEISALHMAIGASYAGTRAMTATSGGGMCLMVEALGLAGMTETPVVVVDGQRPGPAIGLPTRTEQADLEFAINTSHGEFPRAVLAPATVENAFWLTIRAFNLSDRYQIPVILLTDQHLASSYATVCPFDLSKIDINRGVLFKGDEGKTEYKRHKVTTSGISPRALPGQEGVLVVTDADEHDEEGHLTEDAGIRTRMVRKRMRKLYSLKKEVNTFYDYGSADAQILLVGWGSTCCAIHEAVILLRAEGWRVGHLHLNELYPLPSNEVRERLLKAEKCYVIEGNATGQLARLIRSETGIKVTGSILKYDGRPFTPAYIARCGSEGKCDIYGEGE